MTGKVAKNGGLDMRLFSGAFFVAMVAVAQPALAQDTDPPSSGFDVSATVTGVSDYNFRGVSLSGRDPAIQGSIDVEHSSGFYAGAWGSSIAKYVGTNMELDVYGGWRGDMGGVDIDVGVLGYFYPGGNGDGNYLELQSSVGKTIGPVELRAGVNYAPDQKAVGSTDNLYLYGQASSGIPGTPVTLTATVGHEDGGFGGPTGKKWDWSLGGELVVDRFTLGLKYTDTDIRRALLGDKTASPNLVFSVGIEF
jgi:uncharacterized protein (TIGR02001 family)